MQHSALAVKRILDVIGASILLTLSAPIVAACAVLIKLQDGGPAFHRRVVGPEGEFDAFKLHTR
jgi:lipopolysaccharide/colanic/teichoic acid biosynthesis glycosyltransferase